MYKIVLINNAVNSVKRCITTSAPLAGKKNFRKFYIPPEVRGTKSFRESQKVNPHPDIPVDTRGVRPITMVDAHGNVVEVPEMIPEFIVPDLTGFTLKPYVSYRTTEFSQTEFSPEDLFNAVYSNKIVDDWNAKRLNEDGSPKTPSEEELLEPEEAFKRARKTGADIYHDRPLDDPIAFV